MLRRFGYVCEEEHPGRCSPIERQGVFGLETEPEPDPDDQLELDLDLEAVWSRPLSSHNWASFSP